MSERRSSLETATDRAEKKRAKLLRKAAYWLTDYASCFRSDTAPGVSRFRDKLRKLAAECRKYAR